MWCWRSSWAELWQNPAGPDLATTAGWEAMLTAPTRVPLTVDTGTGLLSGVRQVLSPNFDARPAGATPEVLIVHGISLPPGEADAVHYQDLGRSTCGACVEVRGQYLAHTAEQSGAGIDGQRHAGRGGEHRFPSCGGREIRTRGILPQFRP